MTAIEKLIQHLVKTTYDDLPDSAIEAAKTFIFDSIGVGISGSRVEKVEKLKDAYYKFGQAQDAQVWHTGEWLPANAAAAINGYQIHNQEWDCVHEQAVVHPMAVILSALVAFGQREQVSGKQLILGVCLAVDVATLIGASVTSGLKFFRPSICGALGATAGMAAMLELDEETVANALGIAYSQISGTMQAHVEGSPMLAMQIGINACNAVNAVDLACAGFSGPRDILEGPYGYFNLFEDSYDLAYFDANLGKQFQIECVSHKPFPTGRAGHGTVDGLQTLQQQYGFEAKEVKAVTVTAPPLIHRLVGRPVNTDMDASYAKLCNGYIAATALLTGSVGVEDFEQKYLKDPTRLSLAQKVTTRISDVADPNALAPVTVDVELHSGKKYSKTLDAVLGHPDRPLAKPQQVRKFILACKSAKTPLNQGQIDKLINGIDELPQMENINQLVQLTLVSN